MSERDYVAADDLAAFLAEKDAVCGEVQTLPTGRVVTCTKPRGHLAHSAPGCVWEHPGYTRARSERDAALATIERVRALIHEMCDANTERGTMPRVRMRVRHHWASRLRSALADAGQGEQS